MIKRAFAAYDMVLDIAGYVPGVLGCLIALGMGTDVVLRGLGYPIFWMLDAVQYALLVIGLSAAATVLRMGRHIRIDLFLLALPDRPRYYAAQAGNLLCCAISVIIVYYGVAATLLAHSENSTFYKTFRVQEWIPLSLIPICFTLVAIECLRQFWDLRQQGQSAIGERNAEEGL